MKSEPILIIRLVKIINTTAELEITHASGEKEKFFLPEGFSLKFTPK